MASIASYSLLIHPAVRGMGGSRASRFLAAVAVIVIREDRVLALRRAASASVAPGVWETVSGRVRPGEALETAACREAMEETGRQVRVEHRPVDAYLFERNSEPAFLVLYRGIWPGGEVCLSREHDAFSWWTADQFRAAASPPRLIQAIERALEP